MLLRTGNLTIVRRLWLVIGVVFVVLLGLSAWSFHVLEQRATTERQAKVRAAVDLAESALARYAALAESGKMTREEAQFAAKESVRGLRYEGGNYFFMYDFNGWSIMHPTNPDLQGKSQMHLADVKGVPFVREFVRVATSAEGHGYVHYSWPKAGMAEPARKLAYVRGFPAWGWLVGSGIYLDDLDAAMATERLRVIAMTALMLVILASAAYGAARSVRHAVAGICLEAQRLESAVHEGDLSARGDPASVGSEFRSIVDGMNRTVDALVEPIRTSATCVALIAAGEIPDPLTAEYRGEFRELESSLNALVEMLGRRGKDIDALIQAAVEGRLDYRADSSAYQGKNARVIDGMNEMLDAVVRPIKEARRVLEQMARRDLSARVIGEYRGDHAAIKDAVNATGVALHDALTQVANAVQQVSSSASQIASSSQAVASGASEQASSLEETASSLESLSSITKHAADNAQQASALASTANGAAAEGTTAMVQMTGAMGKIKTSAQGTSQIIKDINEIAFQTNLLALNAAVEAARAGEAGRGFAVVAEEVRSLALRSKEAANKTEELIRQSVKEAGEGEVTAKHVNQKLSEIAVSVSKVTEIVTEIAATAKEQASGFDQVNKAMSQMNTVTQQNAASSEESSSAAAELSGRAEELAVMVGSFQMERGGMDAQRAPAGAPAAAVRSLRFDQRAASRR